MDIKQEGAIFSGKMDEEGQLFILSQVKNLDTQTVLSRKQLQGLREHLLRLKQQGAPFAMTINDQLPMMVQPDEMDALLGDITAIESMFDQLDPS